MPLENTLKGVVPILTSDRILPWHLAIMTFLCIVDCQGVWALKRQEAF